MDHAAWTELLHDRPLPCAIVDLDAVAANRAVLDRARARRSVTIRVASKSLRIPALLDFLAEAEDTLIAGVMPYSAREAAFLATRGWDDLLMGYPVGTSSDADVLAELAQAGQGIVATVDCEDHVALLASAARRRGTDLALCIDIDVSLRPAGDRVHIGVRRSPIRDVNAARRLADRIRNTDGVHLTALLAYEAQVAGLPDRTRGGSLLDPVRRAIKERSIRFATEQRRDILNALVRDGHDIRTVNGGGTGSMHSTSADPAVTEVTAGSGFLCPHLFDGYDNLPLQPAAFFALPVVRHSDPGFVTCFGGGYIASGSTGSDRAPIVHLPPGLTPTSLEGWGEVQTPLRTSERTPPLPIGAPIIARHAKSGEPFERFRHVLLVRDGRVEAEVPTYRGAGQCFG